MRRKLKRGSSILLQLIHQCQPRPPLPNQREGCLEVTGYCKPGGYPVVQYALKRFSLPDLLWTLRHDYPVPRGRVIYQTCGNRKCIERSHFVLRPASTVSSERVRARPIGQRGFVGLRGEANSRAVLTNEQVMYMRRRCEEGASIRSMAKEHGIAYSHAWGIIKRQHWAHI